MEKKLISCDCKWSRPRTRALVLGPPLPSSFRKMPHCGPLMNSWKCLTIIGPNRVLGGVLPFRDRVLFSFQFFCSSSKNYSQFFLKCIVSTKSREGIASFRVFLFRCRFVFWIPFFIAALSFMLTLLLRVSFLLFLVVVSLGSAILRCILLNFWFSEVILAFTQEQRKSQRVPNLFLFFHPFLVFCSQGSKNNSLEDVWYTKTGTKFGVATAVFLPNCNLKCHSLTRNVWNK